MLIKLFFKEWRENLPVFGLALALLLALAALNLSGQQELTLYLSGMFLWLFLPFSALLFGSSGYESEFKDNAWVYLFSLPVKKGWIWWVKYAARLSLFLSVFLLFSLLMQYLPGLKASLENSGLLFMMHGLLAYSPYLMISLLALTIAYSISFLSEKPFVLVFTAILIGAGFLFLLWKYQEFLIMTYFLRRGVQIMAGLGGAAFAAASLIVFTRCDFSQRGRNLLRFTRTAALFLIICLPLHMLWVTGGKVFSPRTLYHPTHAHKTDGGVTINSFQHGLVRYDGHSRKFIKLNRASRFSNWLFSLEGGKAAFIKDIRRERRSYPNLWVMNEDGSGARALIETQKHESPFHNRDIESCLLSSDGGHVAFVVGPGASNPGRRELWRMRSDGTRLQKITIDLPGHRNFQLTVWPGSGENLFFTAEVKQNHELPRSRLIGLEVDTGRLNILAENLTDPQGIRPSPRHDVLVFRHRTPGDALNRISLLDLNSLSTELIHSSASPRRGSIRWDPRGDKIAFWHAGNNRDALSVYRTGKGIITGVPYHDPFYGLSYDWLSDGVRIAACRMENEGPVLTILDENLAETQRFALPEEFRSLWRIWGGDDTVLAQRSRRGGFWLLDLNSGIWEEIF